MIRRVGIYLLPKGADPEEFWKYHREVHSVDVKAAWAPRGLVKYSINRVIKVIWGEPKYFGMVETWWESEEAMNNAFKAGYKIKAASGKNIVDDFNSRITESFAAILEEVNIIP